MESINERFFEILNDNRVGPTEFGRSLGASQSSVSHTFNKSEKISKIDYFINLHKMTGCNLNWVILGIGEKYLAKVPEGGVALAAEDMPPYGEMKLMFDTYKNMAEKYEAMKKQLDLVAKKIEKL